MYDAATPEPVVELSRPQVRRVLARRVSHPGYSPETHLGSPSNSGSSQSPSPPSPRPPITLTTPPQPSYPTNDDDSVPLIPPSQNVHTTSSTSFAHVPPLQKRSDHFQSHSPSHSRSRQTHYDQRYSSDSSSDENQPNPTAQTSVVLRTTKLVPSSPLRGSTVMNSRASEPLSHYRPQTEYPVQADPASPYYAFQDTRLVPNPTIRFYMTNYVNPRMFSVQNISPDTLSLLLSVVVSGRVLFNRGN